MQQIETEQKEFKKSLAELKSASPFIKTAWKSAAPARSTAI